MAMERRKKFLPLFIVIAFVLGLALSGLQPAGIVHAAGTTYYVDSVGGSDSNSGTSSSAPWQSLNYVNTKTFQPGDTILLKAGSVWNGQQFYPRGSGNSTSSITIDLYGTGTKPRINGAGAHHNAVYFYNQEYWDINNLEVTNIASTIGDYKGIHITGADYGTMSHFHLSGLYVHDVTGEVNWIGGSTANNSTGINFNTGWDASKNTGGIVFDITTNVVAPNTPTVKSKFDDIIVENSVIKNTSFGGIIVKQYAGDKAVPVNWGVRQSSTDTNWYPNTNVTIRNNYITQSGTTYGCNGIYLTDTQGGLVENNLIDAVGTSGIETYYSDDITIQYNEVHNTVVKAGGADSNGIDPDKGTTNINVQYNYLHDNGDGVLLCEISFGTANIRYNIIKNNTRYPIYLHADPSASIYIYNNVFYNNSSYLTYGYGTNLNAHYYIKNNIFDTTHSGATIVTGGNVSYDSNNYYGSGLTLPSDANKITSNPLFVSAGTGGSGTQSTGPVLDTLDGYKLQATSPDIDSGVSFTSLKPDVDFYGNPLYNGTADIGVYEYNASSSSYVKFKNAATGLYIDGMGRTTNGSNAGQYSGSTSINQQWVIENAGSYVKIKNRYSGLYLDGMGLTANGSIAGQWSGSTSNNQQWTEETAGSNVKFKNRATGLYLDGMGRTTNGSDLGQYSSSASTNQQWQITTP